MFIFILFWLGGDKPKGLLFFVPAVLLSVLMPLFLPFSSVSLSYFMFAVLMHECLDTRVFPNFPNQVLFSHTEWSLFFSLGEIVLWSKFRLSKTN